MWKYMLTETHLSGTVHPNFVNFDVNMCDELMTLSIICLQTFCLHWWLMYKNVFRQSLLLIFCRSRHADSSSEEDLKRGGSKHSRHGGRSSPAMSYRSRHPLSDIDSEDDTMSRKGGRRRRRKSPVPPSPAMSRKSRGRHSPKSRHRKQVPSRANSSDTDSELSSEIEVKRTGSVDQGVAKNVKKLTRSWSKSSKAEDTRDSHTSSVPSTERSRGWECEHCTLVNPPGTTVCSVCCKTSNASLAKSEEDIQEDLQKLKLEDKAEQSGSNGKQENGLKKGMKPRRSISFWIGTKVYSWPLAKFGTTVKISGKS